MPVLSLGRVPTTTALSSCCTYEGSSKFIHPGAQKRPKANESWLFCFGVEEQSISARSTGQRNAKFFCPGAQREQSPTFKELRGHHDERIPNARADAGTVASPDTLRMTPAAVDIDRSFVSEGKWLRWLALARKMPLPHPGRHRAPVVHGDRTAAERRFWRRLSS